MKVVAQTAGWRIYFDVNTIIAEFFSVVPAIFKTCDSDSFQAAHKRKQENK